MIKRDALSLSGVESKKHMGDAPSIILDRVSKIYHRRGSANEHIIFQDFEMKIEGCGVLTIVGPSGCGKSTLLKMIARLIPISGGDIRFQPTTSPPRIGFVFQDYASALAPWRTVLKNVELGLEIEGKVPLAERKARAELFLERVGLGLFKKSYPRELSGGMQQRVQLARILTFGPSVLLMDEPFGSLDAQTRRLLQADLRQILVDLNPTVVFVTHDIEEALFLGDRVVVLSRAPARTLLDFQQQSRPENYDEFVGSKQFPELYRMVWETLRTELDSYAEPPDEG